MYTAIHRFTVNRCFLFLFRDVSLGNMSNLMHQYSLVTNHEQNAMGDPFAEAKTTFPQLEWKLIILAGDAEPFCTFGKI